MCLWSLKHFQLSLFLVTKTILYLKTWLSQVTLQTKTIQDKARKLKRFKISNALAYLRFRVDFPEKVFWKICLRVSHRSGIYSRVFGQSFQMFVVCVQGNQIGWNFAIWAIFYGVGQFFSRKNSPMICVKF